MKCVVLSDGFKKAISLVERNTGKDTTLPILGSLLLRTSSGLLSITATNLEIGITTTMRSSIQKEGSAVLPARVLSSFIGTIKKEEKIVLEVVGNDARIEIGDQKTSIKGFSSDDFPPLPKIDVAYTITFKRDILVKALAKSLICVSRSNIKPELSSVYVVVDGSTAILVSTDSFRLSEERIQISTSSVKGKKETFLLPLRTSEELVRILEYTDSDIVEMKVGRGDIVIKAGDTELYSRLTEGAFPEYQQIIPTQSSIVVTVEKQIFLSHISRASLFANKLNGVTLIFSTDGGGGKCSIESSNKDVGDYSATMPVDLKGDDLRVVFNYHYLLDGIESFSDDTLVLKLNTESKPLVIQPVRVGGSLYIVMPMKAEV